MNKDNLPVSNKRNKITRGVLQSIGGGIPLVGGVLSAMSAAWSEAEQEKVNKFYQHWLEMLQDELREKEETIVEIMARLNLHDETISNRIESKEYQSLLKKTFRDWSGVESEEKRKFIRNTLANAAASEISSDDVVRVFIDWIGQYSELHFQVMSVVYNSNGISRGEIWEKIGKNQVREDSADADLYKVLIRDLSTGGVIRQHRKVDHSGKYIKRNQSPRTSIRSSMKSAFDTNELYELTALGQEFVHYAMTDLPLKIEYSET